MTAYSSTQSGGWSDTTTWGGSGPPGDGDTATVNNGHTVEIDGDTTVGTNPANTTTYVITINAGGVLKWADNPAGDWTLTVKGNIIVYATGAFRIGTEANPVPAARTATLHFPTAAGAAEWRARIHGEFQVCGEDAYHAASSDHHIDALAQDVSSGAVTFYTRRAVDWSVGDTIWFGRGADPTQSVGTCEQVVITGKTDAQTYQATLSSVHHAGDVLVHANRNVIIQGGSTTRGAFLFFEEQAPGDASYQDIKCLTRWALFKYMGTGVGDQKSVIALDILPASLVDAHIPAGNVKFEGLIFDVGGDVLAGNIFVGTNVDFADKNELILDNVCAWSSENLLTVECEDRFRVCNLVALDMTGIGIEVTKGLVEVSGFWYSALDPGTATDLKGLVGTFALVEDANFAVCYAGIYLLLNSNAVYASAVDCVIRRCYFRGATNLGAIYDVVTQGITLRISDCTFHTNVQNGCYFQHVEAEIVDSIFDNNNTGLNSANGAIRVKEGCGPIRCTRCEFGLQSRNGVCNVTGSPNTEDRCRIRMICEDCKFKEPVNWTTHRGVYTYMHDVLFWAAHLYNPANLLYRLDIGETASVELVNPVVYDASDVDQWPVVFPNVDRWAMVHGGGEIRKEDTEVIDETFSAKLLPFHCIWNCCANKMSPVPIPLQSGQTLSVKLSMKKTADGTNGLPGLQLRGPGFFDETFMTPALLNTWEELEAGGTASYDGIAFLYVFAGTNIAGTPPYTPPSPSPDKDDMFAVTVYADGLKIGVS